MDMHYEIFAGKTTIENVEAFLHDVAVIGQSSSTTIQAVDATKLAGKIHIEEAVRQALKSFSDGHNIATHLGVEILLHVSASRQIRKALRFGVHKGDIDVLFVIVGSGKAVERSIHSLSKLIATDPCVIDYHDSKRMQLMQMFNITEKEVIAAGGAQRIPELVRERIALFDAFK